MNIEYFNDENAPLPVEKSNASSVNVQMMILTRLWSKGRVRKYMCEENADINCEFIPYDGFIGSKEFDLASYQG